MKTGNKDIVARVRRFVLHQGLLKEGEEILTALSGGPDSVALINLLDELKMDLRLTVVHLDHGIRGTVSREDALWVKKMAAARGWPCLAGRSRVGELARKEKLSLEAAARRARYDFLRDCARQFGINKVALGHQADDQAETVLMRLLRGTGPEGLAGMRPRSERDGLTLIRPLLFLSREEIESYLKDRSLKFRRDRTNRDLRFTRNRVRRQLLPLLARDYNPRIREILVNLASLEAERDALVKSILPPASEFLSSAPGPELKISLSRLRKYPRALRGEILKRVLRSAGIGELNRFLLRALEGLSGGKTGRELILPGGVVARKEYDWLVIQPSLREAKSYSYSLPVPGSLELEEAGVRISARTLDRSEERGSFPPHSGKAAFPPSAPRSEYLDAARVKFPLTIRSRLPGDRYRPLGLPGKKKIKDILIDEKVPPRYREVIPLIADQEKIIWLAGYLPAQDCRISERTRKILAIEIA